MKEQNNERKSRPWINTEKAIKNMNWIVFFCILIGILLTSAIHFIVKEINFDLTNAATLTAEIIFGVFIALVVYVYSKRMHEENKELQDKTEKRIEQAVEQTANNIVRRVIDIANAQLMVRDGGRVVLRKEETVGADIERNVTENVGIDENVVIKLDKLKIITNDQSRHLTGTVVAENKIAYTIDTVLVTREQQIENLKKELVNARRLYSKLYGKKKKRVKKKKKPLLKKKRSKTKK